MARNRFGGPTAPDWVFDPGTTAGDRFANWAGLTAEVFVDKPMTALADIQDAAGDPIADSVITVTTDSFPPETLGPDDDSTSLWLLFAGTTEPVEWRANIHDRVDTLDVAVADLDTRVTALDVELDAAVAAAVNALVDGAPGALNTLNELAAAVNDDASFAAAVTAALAEKATIAQLNALTASQIAFAPTGGIAAVTVQAAIAELISDVSGTFVALSGGLLSIGGVAVAESAFPAALARTADVASIYAPKASPVFTGGIGLGHTPSARQPFGSNVTLTPAAAGTADKVGHILATTVSGDLSTGTGSNPTFAFGLNVFTIVGTAALDGNAGTISNLIETDVGAPSGTIAAVRGLQVQAAFFGASAGATVTQMESLRVSAPTRKDGAVAGTAVSVYGLFVEAAVAVGASTSIFSVFVQGGVSRFGGRVDVAGSIANTDTAGLNLYAGFADADGARLQMLQTAAGGHMRMRMTTANAEWQVYDGSAFTFAITRTGLPKWTAAGNQQTTVGAAGAAAALPATPTKYLKVLDSAGATLVVPAFAAA